MEKKRGKKLEMEGGRAPSYRFFLGHQALADCGAVGDGGSGACLAGLATALLIQKFASPGPIRIRHSGCFSDLAWMLLLPTCSV